MGIDLESAGQMSLLKECAWRTIVSLPEGHRLITLHNAIPWTDLMRKSIPILYEEHGISSKTGRDLNLQAHLGAYILQTVHGWTDRWTEEMIRYYVPARIFCGFLESTGSLDRTRIENFRNRFGEKGAKLITQDMLNVAKEFGFTAPDDVDMDTTVQESGITHPTEMKLLNHMIKKAKRIHETLKSLGKKGLKGIKKAAKKFSKIYTEYRFFARTKEKKSKAIKKAVQKAKAIMEEVRQVKLGSNGLKKLSSKVQKEIIQLQELGPKLLDQILYWLATGKVAQDKIVSLWKSIPRAIPKGKVGKAVEFGRKWIVNCYRGGYVLLSAPEKAKISDQHCVTESLGLHFDVFGESPKTYGADRGMWSEENIFQCQMAQVKKVGAKGEGKSYGQPKGLQVFKKSSSRNRTKDWAFKTARTWQKSNEKRYWRSYRWIPICHFIQFSPSYERYEFTGSELENNKRILERIKIRKREYC